MMKQQQQQHHYRSRQQEVDGRRTSKKQRSKSVDIASNRHNHHLSSSRRAAHHRRNHHLIINQNNENNSTKATTTTTTIITPPNNKKKHSSSSSYNLAFSGRHVSIDEIYNKINEVQGQLNLLRCEEKRTTTASKYYKAVGCTTTMAAATITPPPPPPSQSSSSSLSPPSSYMSTPQNNSRPVYNNDTSMITPSSGSTTMMMTPSTMSSMSIHERTKIRLQKKEHRLQEIEKEMMADYTFKPITNVSKKKKKQTTVATTNNNKKNGRGHQEDHQQEQRNGTNKNNNRRKSCPPPPLSTRSAFQSTNVSTNSMIVSPMCLDTNRNRPFTDRMEAELRKKRMEEEEIKQHCTFKPNMDWSNKMNHRKNKEDHNNNNNNAFAEVQSERIETSPLSRSTKENHDGSDDCADHDDENKQKYPSSTLHTSDKKEEANVLQNIASWGNVDASRKQRNESHFHDNQQQQPQHQHQYSTQEIISFFNGCHNNTNNEANTNTNTDTDTDNTNNHATVPMTIDDHNSVETLTLESNDDNDLPPAFITTTTISKDRKTMYDNCFSINSKDTFFINDFSPSISSSSPPSSLKMMQYHYRGTPHPSSKEASVRGEDNKKQEEYGVFRSFHTSDYGFDISPLKEPNGYHKEERKHFPLLSKQQQQLNETTNQTMKTKHSNGNISSSNNNNNNNNSNIGNDDIRKSLESSFRKEASSSPVVSTEYGSI